MDDGGCEEAADFREHVDTSRCTYDNGVYLIIIYQAFLTTSPLLCARLLCSSRAASPIIVSSQPVRRTRRFVASILEKSLHVAAPLSSHRHDDVELAIALNPSSLGIPHAHLAVAEW